MSSVNLQAREVAAKIVFYGPGLSGKTTTLKKIYESVRPAHRGEMMSLATEGDRTLFFDFLPVKVERVGDCAVRLALYTVPGQVFYNATRKLVLQGADGVVFVADSQPEALDRNRESLKNLEENLFDQGIRLERFPLVFQWNKRDIPNAMDVEDLRAELNVRGMPDFETCAMSGRGILDTLKAITRLVIKDLRTKRIVPAARPTTPVSHGPALGAPAANIEEQIHHHLSQTPAPMEVPKLQPLRSAVAPRIQPVPAPVATHPSAAEPLGTVSALAPAAMVEYVRVAEDAFVAADYGGCVRASTEAVRRGLSFAAEGTLAQQGYLLRVDGGDLLRLETLNARVHHRIDDAAFSLYVLSQVLVRLNAQGLPEDVTGE